MGSSNRIFLLTFVVQLLFMTDVRCSHVNQTCGYLDVQFKMLEMVNNIIELKKANQDLSSDVQQLHQTNQALSSDVQQLKNARSQVGGIYTQWGRSNCTKSDAELVYSGIAGGAHYTHTGGAAEYVCLPKDPIYPANVPERTYSYLYGAEYEQSSRRHQDVPCAVCRSRLNIVVMIPARDKCYNGWTQQYHGTLASGHYTHVAASQYVCLDANPEVREGGQADKNGKLFYSVQATCSNLPCPLYQSGKILSCVVCAK